MAIFDFGCTVPLNKSDVFQISFPSVAVAGEPVVCSFIVCFLAAVDSR